MWFWVCESNCGWVDAFSGKTERDLFHTLHSDILPALQTMTWKVRNKTYTHVVLSFLPNPLQPKQYTVVWTNPKQQSEAFWLTVIYLTISVPPFGLKKSMHLTVSLTMACYFFSHGGFYQVYMVNRNYNTICQRLAVHLKICIDFGVEKNTTLHSI